MSEVRINKATKVYPNGFIAVHEFTLTMADEEFIVLVGPSGCGKSTMLRMVAGLEEISGGTIAIGDRVVNDVPPKDRDIAMVFQNYALYPHMTVFENMAFGLKLRKFPKSEIAARVNAAARKLGIESMLERKPAALSGGQRQRVAVGRAIVRQPRVFLFDEPLSNLDAKLRVEMRAELKRLHQSIRTTTLYVTHDQEEAMTLGDRIVVMKGGLIQQCGTPLEVYNRPVNRFVAGFVGTPPMNFVNGRLVGANGGISFDEGTFQLRLPDDIAGRLRSRVGTEVVLGLRPEGMSLHPIGRFQGADNVIACRALVMEPLGEKMDVLAVTDRTARLVARVDAETGIRPDQTIRLHVDMRKVHVFEADSEGASLSLNETAATSVPAQASVN